jgi:hypothetical protein
VPLSDTNFKNGTRTSILDFYPNAIKFKAIAHPAAAGARIANGGGAVFMKLIVVKRSKNDTYYRLADKFADDMNVRVVWDRRRGPIRAKQEPRDPDRRKSERRRLKKEFEGRDYVVIHVVETPQHAAR